MGIPQDVIVVTPEEFEAYRDAPGTVIRTARQEGKVLYAHSRDLVGLF